MSNRIHIFGASGSGTTTLGAALAGHLAIAHFDTDDYYWLPSYQPYILKRPVEERLRLLEQNLGHSDSWVLSGSLCGWGDPLIRLFTKVVYLDVPTQMRMTRLRQREQTRYADRVSQGGDLYEQHVAFLSWAEGYETAGLELRSRLLHKQWIINLPPVPVLILDGAQDILSLVSTIL
jgi:adenylate kinase family enzyme